MRSGKVSSLSNKVRLLIMILAVLLLVSGCNKGGANNPKHDFAIYLVKDSSTKGAMSKNLAELSLEPVPLLTDKEIERYDWKEHTFYLKEGVSLEQKLEGQVPLSGRPFVFVVDGTRIYLGTFWNVLSSLYYPDIPTINSIWSGEYDNNKYAILYGLGQQDPRNDPRIYEALKSLNKLGII